MAGLIADLTHEFRRHKHLADAALAGLSHAAYHVGQILYLARLLNPEADWLTIAPGASADHRPGYRKT